MAALSRTAQFTRLHKILARHYKPVAPDPQRSVLEHLLFACCLENAHYGPAEEAFAAMVDSFFDWNEIRVSTVRELSEVIAGLPDPRAAAQRFKRVLQSIFEATYSFDLEELRKLSLGAAQERLEKIDGTTKFSIAYVTQAALGGHAIPLDAGTLAALALVNLATEAEVASGCIAGLERFIPKNVGLEFASLVHQLGADYVATPFSRKLHEIFLEIDPSAADRLPSRRLQKPEPAAATAESVAQAPAEKPPPAKRKAAAGEAAAQAKPTRKAAEKASRPAGTGSRSASPAKKASRQPTARKESKAPHPSKSGKAPSPPASESSVGPPSMDTSAVEPVTGPAVPASPVAASSPVESNGALPAKAPQRGSAPLSATPADRQASPEEGGAEMAVTSPPSEPAAPLPPAAPKTKPTASPQRGKRKPAEPPRADAGEAGTSPAARLSKRKPR